MKTEGLIPNQFFKKFKTGEELNNFLKSIQKHSIEKMLEGELDAHLDYDNKHYCNGKFKWLYRDYTHSFS